jgi:hypothetical protein
LFVALSIIALALAATAIAPMTAVAGGMRGVCPLCRANSATDHAIPKMPLCGIPACAAAADYPIGPGATFSGNTPKAEPPPPRSILPL